MAEYRNEDASTAAERRRRLWQSRKVRSKAGLVGLSSAAILSVYAAGFVRTSAGDSVAANAAIAEALATTAPTSTATATRSGTTPATAATPTLPPATATTSTGTTAAGYRDGSYTGTGSSRHGSIGVTVVVSGGRIVSAEITSCQTKYPCSKVSSLPAQVITRQSASVNSISGATDSSRAYASAVAAALAKAQG
ncbi:FMN-binding protein [Candidatus Amarobacter glycogenicus]|uniref:FMN-binding protein n=1 Tax=Candidatus Amarobacter glycogenicus TaxID=3140699 RepID=UPI0031355847|nr:FMN-binding protein [Dehalococcoidia bacterium]